MLFDSPLDNDTMAAECEYLFDNYFIHTIFLKTVSTYTDAVLECKVW